MSLAFKPQTEEEVLNLLKPGIYDFHVKNAEDTISRTSGNPMIKITLNIWDETGRERIVIDYLLVQLMYKIKHFCDATGIEDKYSSGNFSAQDCKNLSGKCKIRIDEDDAYPPKNSVQDYIKRDALAILSKNNVEEKPLFNDDIPF